MRAPFVFFIATAAAALACSDNPLTPMPDAGGLGSAPDSGAEPDLPPKDGGLPETDAGIDDAGSFEPALEEAAVRWSFAQANQAGPKRDTLALGHDDAFLFVGGWFAGATMFDADRLRASGPLWAKEHSGDFGVTAARHADRFFGAWQSATSTEAVVAEYRADSETPVWSYRADLDGFGLGNFNAANKFVSSTDGSTVAVSAFVRIEESPGNFLLEPRILFFKDHSQPEVFAHPTLRGPLNVMMLSDDGSLLTVHAGARVLRINVRTLELVTSVDVEGNTPCMAASADGNWVVHAFSGYVVYRFLDGAYTEAYRGEPEIPGICGASDLDFDADNVVLAWSVVDAEAGNNVILNTQVTHLKLSVGPSSATHFVTERGEGPYQDTPVRVQISPDGQQAAVASWGTLGDTNPEVLFYDLESLQPLAGLNTPGSPSDLSYSADGETLFVCGKAIHANQNGRGGFVSAAIVPTAP